MQQFTIKAGLILMLAMASGPTLSAVLFSDQMNNAATWGINATSADTSATFNYDYSADGIAEAPNSQAGDAATRGVKLEANIVAPAALETFVLYPLGQNFTGSYQLRFDAWMNYDNDERQNGSSAGTTELMGGGIGYNGTDSSTNSGVQAISTNDGGSGSDWRVFKEGSFLTTAAMAGGTRNGLDPYYSDFLTGVTPPAAQGQPNELGVAGSPGFQWITWQFTVNALLNQVLIDIEKPNGDLLRIADIDCLDTSDGSSGCNTDGNISLIYADFFSSVTARPDLTFGIIDNVFVSDVPEVTVPVPASFLLLGLGFIGVGYRRWKQN